MTNDPPTRKFLLAILKVIRAAIQSKPLPQQLVRKTDQKIVNDFMKKQKLAIAFLAIFSLTLAHLSAAVLDGPTTPASGLGADGDYYIRTTNSTLYKKTAGAWSLIANIRASKGDRGDAGATGQRGLQGPPGAPGQAARTFTNSSARTAATPGFTGQLGVQLDDYTLWVGTATTAGAWQQVGEQGPQGEPGTFSPSFIAPGADLTTGDTIEATPDVVRVHSNSSGGIVHVPNGDLDFSHSQLKFISKTGTGTISLQATALEHDGTTGNLTIPAGPYALILVWNGTAWSVLYKGTF